MIDLQLFFLGDRNYVNGLTIFEEMIAGYRRISPADPPIRRVKAFKIHRFVRNHCRLVVAGNEAGDEQPAAHIVLSTGDREALKLTLLELTDRPVRERRVEYDRSAYIADEDEGAGGRSTATLAQLGDTFALVRGIVEANHRYCIRQAAARGATGRVSWGYMTDFVWPEEGRVALHDRVEFTTKSIIQHNHNVYVIRRFNVAHLGAGRPAELCFFFDDPEPAGPPRQLGSMAQGARGE